MSPETTEISRSYTAEDLPRLKAENPAEWAKTLSEEEMWLGMSTDGPIKTERRARVYGDAETRFLLSCNAAAKSTLPPPVVETSVESVEIATTEEEQKPGAVVVSIESKVTTWEKGLVAHLTAVAAGAKGLTISGHVEGEKAGYNAVREKRLQLRAARLNIQKESKELVEIVKNARKVVDSTTSKLLLIVEPDEDRLKAMEDEYEAVQERIKREAEEAKQRKESDRWEEMQSLNVRPLDFALCQSASDEQWKEYVIIWTADKKALDEAREAEEAREAAAEAERLSERQKKEASERTAVEAERTKNAEEKALADAQLKAEREENARIKAELEKLRKEKEAKEDEEARIIAEKEEKLRRLEIEKAEAEQAELDRPDLEKLDNWRMDVRLAIEFIGDPVFSQPHVAAAFAQEKEILIAAIPQIFPAF